MRVDPSMSVYNRTDVEIDFNLPIFVGISGKNSTTNQGKCFVRTNWSQGDVDPIGNINSLNISTQYPHAWNESLYRMIGDNVNYNIGSDYVEITQKVKDIKLTMDYYYIYVQVGVGWIL